MKLIKSIIIATALLFAADLAAEEKIGDWVVGTQQGYETHAAFSANGTALFIECNMYDPGFTISGSTKNGKDVEVMSLTVGDYKYSADSLTTDISKWKAFYGEMLKSKTMTVTAITGQSYVVKTKGAAEAFGNWADRTCTPEPQ